MEYNFLFKRNTATYGLFLIIISIGVMPSIFAQENQSTDNTFNTNTDLTNQYIKKFAIYNFESSLITQEQTSSLSGVIRYDVTSYDNQTEQYTITKTSNLRSSEGEDFSNIETTTTNSPKNLEIEKILVLIDKIIPGLQNTDITSEGISTVMFDDVPYKTIDSKYSITKRDLLGSQEVSGVLIEPTLESKISGKLKVLESKLPYSIEFQLISSKLVGVDDIREDVMVDFGPIIDAYENMQFKISMTLVDTNFDLGSSTSPSTQNNTSKGGGCLITTATYGSELAPQVQQLRELRDNSLLQTASGIAFMSSFNDFYYSFSPTIADWERENPVFKEMVKITLTPMISSLSILNYVDMDSEVSVLGYGISLIILNVGMYFVAPIVVIRQIKKKF